MNAHPQFDMSIHGTARRELPDTLGIEQAFLGTLLMTPAALEVVPSFLEAGHFELPAHSRIFEKVMATHRDGKVANLIVVKADMPVDKIGEKSVSQYLAMLCQMAAIPKVIPQYASIIKMGCVRRGALSLAPEFTDAAYLDELQIPEELDRLTAELDRLRALALSLEDAGQEDAADEYLNAITGAHKASSTGGAPMPLPELSKVLSDHLFREKRLYGLLSSSGEGKTSLTMQILYAAIMAGHPVLFLSYEQSRTECIAQMAAQVIGTDMRRQMEHTAERPLLRENEIDECYQFARRLMSHPFEVIDCKAEDTADRLIHFAKRFIKRKGNGKTPFIAIDHARAIKPEDGRADEGTKALVIGQKLKSLAKETDSSVLLLQQRSGGGLKRSNPRPVAADLYGGEAARQPFDAIFYLYRAEHHQKEQLDTAADDSEREKIKARFRQTYEIPFNVPIDGTAELGCLKLRFGDRSVKAHIDFEPRFTRYKSRAQHQQDQGRLM